MEITPSITDSRYYGIVDTSCGPQQTFLLFYSRYNGHLGRIFLLYVSGSTLSLKIPLVITSVDKNDKQENIKCSSLIPLLRTLVITDTK